MTPTPEEFFTTVLPDDYSTRAAGAAPSILAQESLAVNYDVDGTRYGLRFVEGALAVVPGGISEPVDMLITVSAADWPTYVSSWREPGSDYYLRGKVKVIKGLKGTMRTELTREDGSELNAATVFADQAEPEVTVRMSVADYAAMVGGTLSGNMAFMTGKLKFDGSMPLLMQLGALSA